MNDATAPAVLIECLSDHAALVTINRPEARHAIKRDVARGLHAAIDQTEAELRELSARAQAVVMASDDFREGPRAFIEKRAPRWTGR